MVFYYKTFLPLCAVGIISWYVIFSFTDYLLGG